MQVIELTIFENICRFLTVSNQLYEFFKSNTHEIIIAGHPSEHNNQQLSLVLNSFRLVLKPIIMVQKVKYCRIWTVDQCMLSMNNYDWNIILLQKGQKMVNSVKNVIFISQVDQLEEILGYSNQKYLQRIKIDNMYNKSVDSIKLQSAKSTLVTITFQYISKITNKNIKNSTKFLTYYHKRRHQKISYAFNSWSILLYEIKIKNWEQQLVCEGYLRTKSQNNLKKTIFSGWKNLIKN